MLDIKKYEYQNVSNEGISDIVKRIKSFLGKSNKPRPPKRKDKDKKSVILYSEQIKIFNKERKELLQQFKDEIQKTYLNDKWLSENEFVTTEFAAKDINGNFILDGKYQSDFQKAVIENIKRLKEVEKYKEFYNTHVKLAIDLDERLCKETKHIKDPDNLDEDEVEKEAKKLAAIIKPYLSKIENMDVLETKLNKIPNTYLPNFKRSENKNSLIFLFVEDKLNFPDTITPLTKENIKVIAKLAIDAIDYLLGIKEWQFGGSYEDDGEVMRSYYDWPESLVDEWYNLTYYQTFWYYRVDDLEDGMFDVLIALEKYMDRSVKD